MNKSTFVLDSRAQYSFVAWLQFVKRFKFTAPCENGCHLLFRRKHEADVNPELKHQLN